jgi:hypothetical protein
MHIQQESMFGARTTPLQNEIMVHIDEAKRSPKRLRDLIMAYVDTVNSLPDPRQTSLLGGGAADISTTEGVWKATLKRYKETENPKKTQGALF